MARVGGRGERLTTTPGGRLFHEPRDVVVEEGQRLLDLAAHRFRPVAGRGAAHDDALDDEPVRRLEGEGVLHPPLVEEGADRAEDLLEVLARAALVDPHADWSSLRSRWSGPGARDTWRGGTWPG